MNTIHINRPEISSEEIRQYMDFQSILNPPAMGALKKPFYRNIWLNSFVGAAIVSVILFAIFVMKFTGNHSRKQITSFVNPPVANWDIPYQTAIISNKKDTILHFPSGSFVKIPKNSLFDENNQLAGDSVEIRFREISSPAEIFLSGIPMEYDSAGIRTVFESAGMIDIQGWHNHQPVTINPLLPLEITMVSKTKDPGYNLYYLDTVARNWVYRGKDVVHAGNEFTLSGSPKVAVNHSDPIKPISPGLDSTMLVKPEPPKLADQKKAHLTLDLLKGEFPDLDIFGKTLFEIDESFKVLDKKHAGIVWENVMITKGNKPLSYFVDFKTKGDSCRYLVFPVVDAKDAARTTALYDSSYRQYQKLLEQRQADEAKAKEKMALSKKNQEGEITYVERSVEADATLMTIQRSFQIRNFGIWNCDRLRLVPNEQTIIPVIYLNDTIYNQTVFLADNSSNSLISIYHGCPLKYNEKANNTLWMVTYNNKVAIYSSEEFKSLPKTNPRCRLNMHVLKTAVKDAGDFIRLYQNGFRE